MRSDWVREEVETCLEREQREKRSLLFPIAPDDAVMETDEAWAASIRRQRHIGNFRDWKSHDAYGQARLERKREANSKVMEMVISGQNSKRADGPVQTLRSV